MPRHVTLIRTLAILRTLQAGHTVTLRALSREHHVHPRTIRRDLDALEAAGYPLVRAREVERWSDSTEPQQWALAEDLVDRDTLRP